MSQTHVKKDQLKSWIYLSIVVLTSFPTCGLFHSFGIFLDIFLREYGGTNTEAGWIGSVLFFNTGISSLLGVYLFRYFGLRPVLFASAILTVISYVATPNVVSIKLIFLTYSIPFGIAMGFHDCVSVVTLREYFSKYLGMATGIRFTATVFGAIVFNFLIPILFNLAGFHTLMTCFSSMGILFVVHAMAYKPPPKLKDHEDSSGIMSPTLRENNKVKVDLLQATKSLLRNKRNFIILTAIAIFSTVQYIPNMFLIQYARSLGYPLSESKWMLVYFSLSSIVSRLVSGCLSDTVRKFNILKIVLSGILLLFGLFSALGSFTKSMTLMKIYMCGIGVLDGIYWVWLSLVAMEIIQQDSDILYTLMCFAAACGFLVGPPAIGRVYDVSGKFSYVFYMVSAGAIVSGLLILAASFMKVEQSQQVFVETQNASNEQKKVILVVFERETAV